MKHDIDSHERWDPRASWWTARFHPPVAGETYSVKNEAGEVDVAYFGYGGYWKAEGKIDPTSIAYYLAKQLGDGRMVPVVQREPESGST